MLLEACEDAAAGSPSRKLCLLKVGAKACAAVRNQPTDPTATAVVRLAMSAARHMGESRQASSFRAAFALDVLARDASHELAKSVVGSGRELASIALAVSSRELQALSTSQRASLLAAIARLFADLGDAENDADDVARAAVQLVGELPNCMLLDEELDRSPGAAAGVDAPMPRLVPTSIYPR